MKNLTPQEQIILKKLNQSKSIEIIAKELFITEDEVKKHIENLKARR